MPTTLNDTLLEGGSSASPNRSRRGVAVVAVAALVLSVGLVGYSIGKHSGGSEFDRETIQAKLVSYQKGIANQTEMAVVANSARCYGYTGGTCLTKPCNSERNAKCLDGKCSCVGGCTDAHGVCSSAAYKRVGTKFSLTNKKWSGSWLFMQSMSVLSQLKVSSAASFTFGGQQYFDLFELPGYEGPQTGGKKQYFLASNYWPAWVASLRPTGSIFTGSVSLYGLFGVSLAHSIDPWNPQSIMVHMCSMKKLGYENEVMIGGMGPLRTEWAYVHHGSWFVYGWNLSPDPGEGGYWTVSDPKILQGMDDC